MKRCFSSLLCLLLLGGTAGKAQTSFEVEEKRNEVKLNLFSLSVSTVSLQYERNLRPHVTLALGLRFSPVSRLPFRNQFFTTSSSSGNEDVVTEALNATRVRNFALTPEMRYYFRRDGEARGLYGALFARYSSYGLTSSFRTKSNSTASGFVDVGVDGTLRSGSLGLMLGAKFRLSNTVMLDWWIAGPMYTSGTLRLNADLGEDALTQEDRDRIQSDADRGISIGPVDLQAENVTFRTDGFSLKVPVQYFELRTGLAVGIRF